MKVENDKSLSGAIVFERGTKILAKLIILHMNLLAKMKGHKPLKYSHAEILLWNEKEQQLYTIGARGSGTEKSKVQDYYKEHEILILKPVKPITEDETAKLWEYFKEVDKSKYQYGNFFAWILFLKTLIWISKKGDKKNYCYELVARFINEIKKWYDGKKSLDQVSLFDLYDNMHYWVDNTKYMNVSFL